MGEKMFKKIAISIMGLILLSSIILSAYKIFEPKTEITSSEMLNSFYTNLNNLEEYTLSTGDNTYHYYFFCVNNDSNCTYLSNSVFSAVKNETKGIELDKILEYVDLSDSIKEETYINKLKKWNISTYPSFVSVKVENNQIVINNTLEYDTNNPLNSTDIIEWLKLNNLYNEN